MSFIDPQSVTINAVANSLPRTQTNGSSSVYSSADGNVKLTISSAYGKRNRRTVRIDFRKTAADPITPAVNSSFSMSTYIVADVPPTGFSIVEQKQIVDALTGFLTASSGAAVTRMLGGES